MGKEAGEVFSRWVTEGFLHLVKECAFNFVDGGKMLNGSQQRRDNTLCFMYMSGSPWPLLIFIVFIPYAQHKKFIDFLKD